MSTNAVQAAPGSDLKLVQPGRGLGAGAGVTWIGEGWKLFAKSPLMWIVAVVILFVIAIVAGLIPFIGQLAFQIVNPVFMAGFIVACRAIETGGEFELEHLFAGFKSPHLANLCIVGAIFLVASIVIVFAVFAVFGLSIGAAILAGDPENAMAAVLASSMLILLATLVMLALMVPLMAAYWFAPALVMMHGMKPLDAMKESFFSCFRNFLAFVVWGIVMTVLAILAVIPLGLGMLVWIPLAIASTYAAYRAIFTEP